jgi:hypothetical protein
LRKPAIVNDTIIYSINRAGPRMGEKGTTIHLRTFCTENTDLSEKLVLKNWTTMPLSLSELISTLGVFIYKTTG